MDAKTLLAALNELEPLRQQILKLWVWDAMSASDIVRYLTVMGIQLSETQVIEYLEEVRRHCLRRRQEAEHQHDVSGAMPH